MGSLFSGSRVENTFEGIGIAVSGVLGVSFFGAMMYYFYVGLLPNILIWTHTRGLDLMSFLPVSLALFGFFIDLINQELRYGIGSLVAMTSTFVNFLTSRLIELLPYVNTTPPAYVEPATAVGMGQFGFCTVPGFESLESVYAPQAVVFTSSMFMYYLIDFLGNRSIGKNIGFLSLFGTVLLFQTASLMATDNCKASYFYRGNYVILSILTAVAIGSLYGYFAWQTVSMVAPASLPSHVTEAFMDKDIPVINRTPVKIKVGGSDEKNLPVNDEDQFVCEAYKDGELVTSTIVS